MKTSTKWFLGILIGVIIICAGVFTWQKLGWTTYKNTDYGFSLRFDRNWQGYKVLSLAKNTEQSFGKLYRDKMEQDPNGQTDYITVMIPTEKLETAETLKAYPSISSEVVAFIVMTPTQWENNQKSKNKYTLVGETKNYVISSRVAELQSTQPSDNGKNFYSTYIPNLIKTFQKID